MTVLFKNVKKSVDRAMLGVTIPNFGQSKTILLQVPPGNNVDSDYKLRVEGAGRGGGAIIFENETMLEFSRQFLSVSISTNRAIYSGTQKIEIRAIMLTTALQPYTGIADLFIIGKSATTLPSMMNAKLSPHRFWPCHENGLIKTIQMIPHNLEISLLITKPFGLFLLFRS